MKKPYMLVYIYIHIYVFIYDFRFSLRRFRDISPIFETLLKKNIEDEMDTRFMLWFIRICEYSFFLRWWGGVA